MGNGMEMVQLGNWEGGSNPKGLGWDLGYPISWPHGPRCFFFPQNAGTQVDGHEMWRPRLRGARHVELGIWCCELGSDFNQHI